MIKLNKGIYKKTYVLCLCQRGHVKYRIKDIIVRLGGTLVEKVGYIREQDIVIYQKKFLYWVRHGVYYTPSLKRYLSKFSAYFNEF
jgi:hypothetical protein